MAMDIRKIKKLIEVLEESNLVELEIREGEETVRLSRWPKNMPMATMAPQMAPMQVLSSAPQAAPTTAGVSRSTEPRRQRPGSTSAHRPPPPPCSCPPRGEPRTAPSGWPPPADSPLPLET